MSGAAEDAHVREAVQDCLAKLQANRIAAAATPAEGDLQGSVNDDGGSSSTDDNYVSDNACDSYLACDYYVDDDGPQHVYDEDGDVIDIAPRMPRSGTVPAGHREKRTPSLYNACVARPVKPAELKTNDAARAAMQVEWDRLRKVERPDGTLGVWDEGAVEEWDVVRRRAKRLDHKVNVGLVFGIAVEKSHELDINDKRRKYKGRAVFQGNNVRDE